MLFNITVDDSNEMRLASTRCMDIPKICEYTEYSPNRYLRSEFPCRYQVVSAYAKLVLSWSRSTSSAKETLYRLIYRGASLRWRGIEDRNCMRLTSVALFPRWYLWLRWPIVRPQSGAALPHVGCCLKAACAAPRLIRPLRLLGAEGMKLQISLCRTALSIGWERPKLKRVDTTTAYAQ